jgi:hypothetical protein
MNGFRGVVRTPKRLPTAAGLCMVLGVVVMLSLSGCGTGGLAVKKDIWDAQEDFSTRQAGLSEKVLQLEGRISGLEESVGAVEREQENQTTRIAELDAELARGIEAVRSGQQQLGIELESKIRSTDTARKSFRPTATPRPRGARTLCCAARRSRASRRSTVSACRPCSLRTTSRTRT